MKERIRIIQDQHPLNPREEEDGWLGQMVCWHSGYLLGDIQEKDDPGPWLDQLNKDHPERVLLPLFLYDHGGITMNVGGFACPWDSGQVGWIYCTPAMAKAAGMDWDIPKLIEVLTQEVATYASYLEGDIYGYVIERLTCEDCGTWEQTDSCWGFIGRDIRTNGMDGYIPEHLIEEAANA